MRKSKLEKLVGVAVVLCCLVVPARASSPGDGIYVLDSIFYVGSAPFSNTIASADSALGSVNCSINDNFNGTGTGSTSIDGVRTDWSTTTYGWQWITATNATPADYQVALLGNYEGTATATATGGSQAMASGKYSDSFGNNRQASPSGISSPVQGISGVYQGANYIWTPFTISLETKVLALAQDGAIDVSVDHEATGAVSLVY